MHFGAWLGFLEMSFGWELNRRAEEMAGEQLAAPNWSFKGNLLDGEVGTWEYSRGNSRLGAGMLPIVPKRMPVAQKWDWKYPIQLRESQHLGLCCGNGNTENNKYNRDNGHNGGDENKEGPSSHNRRRYLIIFSDSPELERVTAKT